MSSIDSPAISSPGQPILPPYTLDPQRPAARRARLFGFLAVGLFCLVWGAAFAIFAPYLLLVFVAPIPILAMAAIWALPDARKAPLRTLWAMLFLFIMCLVLWPNYLAIAPPGVPWITMTRLSGFPLVLILLLCASTSVEFRSSVAAAMRSTPLLSSFFIAFTILEAVSIGYSIAPVSSFDAFVNNQINLTAIFFVSVFVFQKPGRVERMARLLWLMSILVCVIAVIEYHEKHPPWAGHIPSFIHIDDPLVERALAGASRFGVYRAEATFGNALGLAEYISLIIPFVVNFLIGPYRPTTRILAALSIPFLLFVVNLTGSRLGLVGCFISVALTGVVWAGPKWARERDSLMAPFISILTPAFLVAAGASTFLVGRIHMAVWGGGAGDGASTFARTAQTEMAKPKLLSHPMGHGIGTGAQALGYYTQGGFLTIDSYYINTLMEYGFIGFILFYGMFVLTIWQCGKVVLTYRGPDREVELLKPIGIAMVVFFIVKSVFAEQYNHPIIFMMLGIVTALAYRFSRETKANELASAAEPSTSTRPPTARRVPSASAAR